jgi:hypothetical protein
MINVNGITLAKYGIVRITIHKFLDVRGLQGTYKTDESPAITDNDEFARAFSSLAIKAS